MTELTARPSFSERFLSQCSETFVQSGRLAINVSDNDPYTLVNCYSIRNTVRDGNFSYRLHKASAYALPKGFHACSVGMILCEKAATSRHYFISRQLRPSFL